MSRFIYLLAILFCVSISYSQQTGQTIDPTSNAPRTPNGQIRCLTTEMDQISRSNFPQRGSLNDFERWIAPHIESYKEQSSRQLPPVLTIPVVFHILTDGSGAENLSAAQVQAQLDQLNLDYRNLAGSTDPVAADSEIEFCMATLDPSNNVMAEPGINRITAYGDGPFSTNNLDNTIKPATIWSPTEYFNIWVGDLQSGLLGYAQFPDASGLSGMPTNGGSANTDGVVILYSSVGSVANPFPGGAPYNKGRTLTHEAGHWLGLRHIWGDGGCSVDDFCGDTPTAGGANYGCPNSTTCGSQDMVENYMDYTDDDCMNIFTVDQRTRMRTVLTVSPRRLELVNSTKCGNLADFSITATDTTIAVCPPNNAVFTINIGETGGFSDPVNLSVSGVPNPANGTLGSSTITPVNSTTLTISNTNGLSAGTYNITVTATSSSGSQTLPLILIISDPAPTSAVSLTDPANGFVGAAIPVTFNWTASTTPTAQYTIEIATDIGFTNIIDQASGLSTNTYTSGIFSASTTYYWRVTAYTACGSGPTSSSFSFTTANCSTFSSTNIPVTISASGTPTITSTLTVPTPGSITDVNVTQLTGTHTWINDLTITLSNPSGTNVTLFDQICNNENNFDVQFDDNAAPGALPCPPVGGGIYQPNTPLSAMNGQPSNGTWTLTIVDNANQDGGSLDNWAIEVCIQPLPSDDAGISSIVSPSTSELCDNPFTPEVELQNYGTTTLTSVDIYYQIDANTPQVVNWSGSLAPGNATNVLLNAITSPTTNTPITLTAYTSNPNGAVDIIPDNDTSAFITQITTALPLPYSEGFNSGVPANISILNIDGDAALWTSNAADPTNSGGSIFIDNYNNDTRNTFDWFILPNLDFSTASNQILTFDVANARYDATYNDTLIVAINDNCGNNYTPIYYVGGADLATAPDNTNLFTPSSTEWRNDTIDLTAYGGSNHIKIAFINKGGYGNGLYIDNINIQTQINCTLSSSLSSQTNVDCNGASTGAASISANNGTGSYTYIWSNGSITNSINNVPSGTYSVTVSDGVGCTSVNTVVITEPSAISVSTTTNNVSCNGQNDGQININTSGGTPTYTYDLGSGSQSNNQFSNLTAGNYTITITDANGCVQTSTTQVTEPNVLNVSLNSITNPTCFGFSDGNISVSGLGGTSPYSFDIGQGVQNNGTFSGVPAGNYTLSITDANGCTSTLSNINLTNPPAISASVVDNGNGSATANVSGGNSPYQYLWDVNAGSQTTQTATGLTNGTYYVTITDVNGCTTTDSVSLFVTSVTKFNINPIFNVYPNPNDGVFNIDLQLPINQEGNLVVTNVLGQQLMQFNNLKGHIALPIKLKEVSKGVYYATLFCKNKPITRKIIVR